MRVVRQDPLEVIEPDDEQGLIERARAGESRAFDALVRREANRVFGFLVRWLGDRALAEDAFQEATLRAFRSFQRLRPGAPFRPWFFRIAINRGKTLLSRRAKVRQREEQSGRLGPTAVPSGETALELRGLLEETLARLSPSDRQILVLRFIDGSSIAEISTMLDVPGFVTKMRLSRARKRFRQLFHVLERAGEAP